MMKNKRKEWKRIAAFTLAALLTVNSIDLSVFTAYAKETKEQMSAETKNAENTELTITGFADLEESIVNQQLAIGALEEEVVFPDTLEVTVSVSDAETKAAETEEIEETAETEESVETETEEETVETEEADTANGETAETEEAETTNGETAETEETETTGGEATKTGESASKEPGNEVNKSVQEADENTSQNTESENSSTEADVQEQKAETDTASLVDTIFSAFAPMTVYAAENENDIVSENSTETTENAEIKEITLTDITWELNPAESDGEGFDSSEDCDGYCYVYTPVLPETDEDGNKVTLGEGVEAPVIYVLIGEGEDHVSTIAVEGYDDEGFCEGYSWVDGELKANTGGGESQCTHGDTCNGYQPATDTDQDGVYEISNAGQLYWFADQVNEEGNDNIKVKLSDNITINNGTFEQNGSYISESGNTPRKWIPIGENEYSKYSGNFNGNGKIISGLYYSQRFNDYVGLFGYATGTIRNVSVQNSYLYGRDYVGGIVGRSDGTIENCINNSIVWGDDDSSSIGGVVGYSDGTVKKCINLTMVNENRGFLIGDIYDSENISECYYLCDYEYDLLGGTTCKTTGEFASGEVTYLLNGSASEGELVWYQNIDQGTPDAYPVLDDTHGIVYRGYASCDDAEEDMTYTNHSGADVRGHNYKNGICARCEEYQPAEQITAANAGSYGFDAEKAETYSGYYAITNAGQLFWFAQEVNSGKETINGVLINDIDLESREWTPIAGIEKYYDKENRHWVEYWFRGTFDGQNYSINNLSITAVAEKQGLFGRFRGDALKNFKITGTIKIDADGVQYVGGVVGLAARKEFSEVTPISNVVSAVYIYGTDKAKENIKYIGGVAGLAGDIQNCRYTGNGINVYSAECVGGIIGGIDDGTACVSNCSNSGDIRGNKNVGGIVGEVVSGSVINCSNSGNINDDIDYNNSDNDYYGTDVGGIAGIAGDIVGIDGKISGRVINCYNSGIIGGWDYTGGLVGFIENNVSISHSYNVGKVDGVCESGAIAGFTMNGNCVENCYYLEGSAAAGIGDDAYKDNTISKTAKQFASGEVAYLLNGSTAEGTLVWYQNVDNGKTKDSYPVWDSTHGIVYASEPCPIEFSNNKESLRTIDHSDFSKCEGDDALQYHSCGACKGKLEHTNIIFTASAADTISGKCGICQQELGSFIITALTDELIYDNNEKEATVAGTIAYANIPEIVYYSVNANGTKTPLAGKPIDAGKYEASITCGEGAGTATAVTIFTITPATPTVTWNESSKTVNYIGNPIASDKLPALTVTGVNNNTVEGYTADDFTYSYRASGSTEEFTEGLPEDRGTYEIKATVHAKGNYNGAETTSNLTLKIDWLNTAETATLTDQNGKSHTGSNWWAQRVTFAAPSGFTISKDEDGTYTDSFTFDNNGTDTGSDGTSVTYYLKNSDGEIAQKTQTVRIDRTAPTFPSDGGIKIKDNWFKSLLNTITFNLFYKENVEVTVNAEDALSGIASYYYWVDTSGSTTVLTAEELSEKSFTKTENSKITATTQDGKYVYYVYVEDKAGNRSSYICSNGVVVDTAAPEVSVTTDTQDVTATLTVTATDTGSGLEGTYYLYYSTNSSDLPGMTVEQIIGDSKTQSNATGEFSLTDLSCAITHYYAVVVKDKAGNAALEKGVFTTEKMMPEFDASAIPTISGTYGQSLSEMGLSKTSATSKNSIAGTWEITEANADIIYPVVNDTTEYEITFTPDDTTHFDTYVATVTPQVAKKKLTINSVTAKGREYNGTDRVTITGVTLDGIVRNDDVSVDVTNVTGTVNGSDVGIYTKVTALTMLSLKGDTAGNYELIQPEGEVTIAGDVTISQAEYKPWSVIKQYYYGKDYLEESISLSDYLPEGYGTILYSVTAPDWLQYRLNDNDFSYDIPKAGSVDDGKSGTVTVTVTTQNYKTFDIVINIEQIEQYPVILQIGTSVTLKNNVLTYGESLSKLKFNTAVFISQDDPNQIITGTLAWIMPDAKPNAGIRSAQWIFTPDASYDGEYASLSGTVSVIVNRATPDVVTAPAVEMSYNPNTELLGIDLNTAGTNVTAGTVKGVDGSTLSGSWSWETPDQVPQVYNSGYKAIFTPSDTNYEPVTRTITVTVAKATPYIDADTLTAEEITYGQTLADSSVQGSVYYDSTKQTLVAGSFVWKNGSSKPTAKDDSNNTRYTVIFKPTDSDNYNEVETEITITVNKAQNAPNMPGSTMSVQNSITKVGDVTLPKDWVWQESDKDTALEVEVAQSATALYEGADQGNYENESVEIILTRSACDHVPGEILYTGTGEHAPDCVNDGLGHRECTKCHAVTESGIVVAALGHQGGTATCKKKAVCTVCHQEYGSTNTDNHAATEIRGHKNADCTSAGYTGDTYCADCGTKLKSGTAIAALGHKYKSVETTAPTTTSTGVRTYTCERCGYSYTETIAKLPEEAHNHSYTGTVTRQADCTNAGVKTYTCSCGDSYTESIPALGHHYISKVTKQATTTAEGIMTYTCDRCGHSYTRPIAKLESNEPDNNKPGNDNKPGDNNNLGDNTKPDTGKPYIEGHTEQNGWDNIKDQLEAAKEKDTVTVEMNGTTVVPGDVFDSIRGKDVKVVFDMGDGITWTVNGKDITADKVGDIDFSVTVGSQAGNTIPVDIINNVTGERYSVNVSLAYDGEFGFTAILTLNVDKENAGLYANLFYYNPETAALEFMSAAQIDENGNAALEFTHASDYTVVLDTEVMSEEGTDDVLTDADENAAWNPLWVIVIGAVILIVGLGIFFAAKKKKEEAEK